MQDKIKYKLKLLFAIFSLIIFVTGTCFVYIMAAQYFFDDSHEDVHIAINEIWGINSSVKEVNLFSDSKVTVNGTEYMDKCDSNCKLAHSINEAIGYQLSPLLVFFGILASLQTFFLLFIAINTIRLNKNEQLQKNA